MIIRDAAPGDLPAVLAIYNDVVATSTAIYEFDPVTLESRLAWLEARRADGYPVLVAADGNEILGYASFGAFRAWPGYQHTVEHSVHIRADQRRKGLGRALVESLLPIAKGLGKHVIVAGIDADNEPSRRLHAALGFEEVGHFRQIGHKFGRWLDLVFMQRLLDERKTPG